MALSTPDAAAVPIKTKSATKKKSIKRKKK